MAGIPVRIRPLTNGPIARLKRSADRTSFANQGLKEHLRLNRHGKPVYIFDHHCFALYGWVELARTGRITPPLTLLRFDGHSDGLPGPALSPDIPLNDLSRLLHTPPLANASFLEPAVRLGLFNRIIWVQPEQFESDLPPRMKNLSLLAKRNPGCQVTAVGADRLGSVALPRGPFLLDVDLDFFQGVRTTAAFLERIGQFGRKAAAVTLATSPEFINDQLALSLARRIIDRL
jgi:hypothetical protein